jgi:hypothetical protein
VKTELRVTYGIRSENYVPHDPEIVPENQIPADPEIITEN